MSGQPKIDVENFFRRASKLYKAWKVRHVWREGATMRRLVSSQTVRHLKNCLANPGLLPVGHSGFYHALGRLAAGLRGLGRGGRLLQVHLPSDMAVGIRAYRHYHLALQVSNLALSTRLKLFQHWPFSTIEMRCTFWRRRRR